MSGIIEKELSFMTIRAQISRIGDDYHIMVRGGREHIGCTVLAVPRPSLTGDGSISSTASVLNVTGHKDEQICRYLAESLCARKNAVVVCTGGVHFDNITRRQIAEVMEAARQIAAELGEFED